MTSDFRRDEMVEIQRVAENILDDCPDNKRDIWERILVRVSQNTGIIPEARSNLKRRKT